MVQETGSPIAIVANHTFLHEEDSGDLPKLPSIQEETLGLDLNTASVEEPPTPATSNSSSWKDREGSTKPFSKLPQNFSCWVPELNQTWTSPVFPHFLIVGAQKAGTTAIGNMLRKMPNFIASIQPEAHFWDSFLLGSRKATFTPERRCKTVYSYSKYFDFEHLREDSIVFEKTPSLLSYPDLPRTLRQVMDPHPLKIIVILRDPIERLYSSYKMAWQTSGHRATYPAVEEVVSEEVQFLSWKGILQAPVFHNETHQWEKANFSMAKNAVSNYAKIRPKKHLRGTVTRGFYSLSLRYYLEHFSLGESLLVIRYEDFLQRQGEVFSDLLKFVGGPPHNFTPEQLRSDVRPIAKKEWYPILTNETRAYLERVFQPFNEDLADLLGEEWRGVWGY